MYSWNREGEESGMSLQIIGTAKCRDTKKCRLWFEQRGISFHFVDLGKRSLSPGELKAIAAVIPWDDMMNRESKAWKKKQLEWKEFNPEEELFEDSLLLKTPVVRDGNNIVIGYVPELWENYSQAK